MFKKIVSSLSFSPALAGQLKFYAKRLKKEQTTRRLGLVFVALALVVQSLAVFQAPDPANASNPGDMIPGGLGLGSARSYNNFVGPYDRNQRNLKDVMDRFGITREEIIAAGNNFRTFTVGDKIGWGYENRPGATMVMNSKGINHVYGRPLNMANNRNDQIWAYHGYSKSIGWFAIQQYCGNLITDRYPPPPPVPPTPPKPPAIITAAKTAVNVTQGNVNAASVVAREGDKITYTVTGTNSGGTAHGGMPLSDNISNVLPFSKLIDAGGGTLSSNGILSWGSAALAPGQTVTKKYTIQVNANLTTTQVNCKMTNNFHGHVVVVPVGCKTPANIVASKTAINTSRGNADATKVVAQENNKITYTVTVRNTGGTAAAVDLKDDLSDVLKFGKVINTDGGKLNASTQVLSWGSVNVGAGQTVTKKYTVQINPSLVTNQENCKMVNNFLNQTVTVPVDCKKPANIVSSKTAVNASQGNVDAVKVTAKEGDKITYTVKVSNTGGVAKSVDLSDNLSDVLEFSTLINNGGGKINSAKVLSWGSVNVGAGQTITKSYTIQLNSSLITTQTNCKITNKFLSNTVVVPVGCKKPANITGSKSAINTTQGKVDASKKTAKANDKITYTIKISNTGGSPKEVALNDDLSSVLKWSKLTDNGGGKLNDTSKVLSWGKVNVKAGQTITKTYTVQLNSSLVTMEKNCKMVNDFLDKSVVVPVGCTTPPAEIIPAKTATNLTQGGVDATTVTAKANDKIRFTLVAENKGGTAKAFVFEDMVGDTLEYAKITDNGGATYNEKERKLTWPTITLQPGEKQTRVFTVQVLAVIPSTPQGLSDRTSYDCKIDNVFYTSAVSIKVECPGPKVIENVVPALPQTGPGENMLFAGILLAIVSFFYFRSRQLGTEVRLIRREVNTGTF